MTEGRTLQRLMGRKLVTAMRFFIFGIKVMKVWFRGWGIVVEFKYDNMVLVTSLPTRLQ